MHMAKRCSGVGLTYQGSRLGATNATSIVPWQPSTWAIARKASVPALCPGGAILMQLHHDATGLKSRVHCLARRSPICIRMCS